eukprot:4539958-Amphidinium_carterae.1
MHTIKCREGSAQIIVQSQENWTVYIISLYWAIETFTSIGYGDVTPETTEEYAVASMAMACSAAAWAFIIGKVCTLTSTMTARDQKFRQNMDNLN